MILRQYLKTILSGTREEGKRSTDMLHRMLVPGIFLLFITMIIIGPSVSKISELNIELSIPVLKLFAIATVLEDLIFKLVPYSIIYLLTSRKDPGFNQNLYVRASFILPIIGVLTHLANLYTISLLDIPYVGVHFFLSVLFAHFLVKYGIIVCWGVHYLYDVILIVIVVLLGG